MTLTIDPTAELRRAYLSAMSRVGAAVKIVTTDGAAGRAGITVTAACSVCQDPPRLLVCVNTSASAHPVIARNGRLTLNVLSASHVEAAVAFGGKVAPECRFASGHWRTDAQGQPVLEGACATFSCEIAQSIVSGTHTIFICDVTEARTDFDADPLLYLDRDMLPVLATPSS